MRKVTSVALLALLLPCGSAHAQQISSTRITVPMGQAHGATISPQRIAGIPAPEDMLTLVEGTPFVVPAGKVFVVTGLSRRAVSVSGLNPLVSSVGVRFDGITQLVGYIGGTGGGWVGTIGNVEATNWAEVPPGLFATEGVSVDAIEETYSNPSLNGPAAESSGATAIVTGYLWDPSSVALRFKGIPAPEQLVYLHEGQSLVVPGGKRLVVTGLGLNNYFERGSTTSPTNSVVNVLFDGVNAHAGILGISKITVSGYQGVQAPGIIACPAGIVADAGVTVTVGEVTWVDSGGGVYALIDTVVKGVMLGYLADV